jgi:hypothetical protein
MELEKQRFYVCFSGTSPLPAAWPVLMALIVLLSHWLFDLVRRIFQEKPDFFVA